MNLAVKVATYMLFISIFDNTSTIPIFTPAQDNAIEKKQIDGNLGNVPRVRRNDPVVQPVWTSDLGYGDIFQNYDVKITSRKLEETEAIRQTLHHIIQNGTFAVDLDKSDFKEDLESESKATQSENGSESEAETESEVVFPLESEIEPAEPAPASEPVPNPINKPRSSAPSKTSKKPKKSTKVDSVVYPFFSWLKSIWANRWGNN